MTPGPCRGVDVLVLAPSPSVTAVLLGDEAVLLDESSGTLHFLGGSAGAIWSSIDGRRSVGLMASQLSERFAADPATVRADVRRTVGLLCRLGLLRPAAAGDGAAGEHGPPPLPLANPPRRRLRTGTGAVHFRTLSFAFGVVCAPAGLGARVRQVLARFEDAPGPVHAEFVIGPATPGSTEVLELWRDGELLLGEASADAVLDHLLWRVGSETAATTSALVLVHAGAVTSGRSGLLLPGPSGSGKSTLVAGLVRAGFGYLSDEVGVVDPATCKLQPFPKSLTLKAGSHHFFPELADGATAGATWHVDPDEVRRGSVAGPCGVSWVIAPTWRPSGPTSLVEMSAGELCYALGRNTMALRFRGAAGLVPLGRLAAGARGARLDFSDLDGAVAEVTAFVGSAH